MVLRIDNQSLVDKNGGSIHFFVHANDTSEWMCLIFMKFLMANFANMVSISICSVFFSWLFYKNLDVESFYHPYKIMLVIFIPRKSIFSIYFENYSD